MTDRGHHGEGQHDERHMAMPTVAGAGLVVVEPEFVLGGLEAVLDRPAMPLDRYQGLDRRSRRTPGGEERQIAIGDGAADQETPCPLSVVRTFGTTCGVGLRSAGLVLV